MYNVPTFQLDELFLCGFVEASFEPLELSLASICTTPGHLGVSFVILQWRDHPKERLTFWLGEGWSWLLAQREEAVFERGDVPKQSAIEEGHRVWRLPLSDLVTLSFSLLPEWTWMFVKTGAPDVVSGVIGEVISVLLKAVCFFLTGGVEDEEHPRFLQRTSQDELGPFDLFIEGTVKSLVK